MSDKTQTVHILPLRLYLGIGLALLIMTVVTVAVAQVDLGAFNLVVAMAIATVKGSLVVLYFMHLRYDSKVYAMLFVVTLLLLASFIVFTMFDTLNRDEIYDITGRPINDQAIIYNQPDTLPLATPAADSSNSPVPDSTATPSEHTQ